MKNIEENKTLIIIEARREEYSEYKAAENTMTIRELINELECWAEDFGDEAKVVLSHDNGYTYGGIRQRMISEKFPEEDEEESEEE